MAQMLYHQKILWSQLANMKSYKTRKHLPTALILPNEEVLFAVPQTRPLLRIFLQQISHKTLRQTRQKRRVQNVPIPLLLPLPTLPLPVRYLLLKWRFLRQQLISKHPNTPNIHLAVVLSPIFHLR